MPTIPLYTTLHVDAVWVSSKITVRLMTVLPRSARASNSQRGLWFQSDQKVVPELYPRRFYCLNPVVLECTGPFGLNLKASKLYLLDISKGFVIEMQVILSPFFTYGTTSILSGKHRPLLGFAFTNTRKVLMERHCLFKTLEAQCCYLWKWNLLLKLMCPSWK